MKNQEYVKYEEEISDIKNKIDSLELNEEGLVKLFHEFSTKKTEKLLEMNTIENEMKSLQKKKKNLENEMNTFQNFYSNIKNEIMNNPLCKFCGNDDRFKRFHCPSGMVGGEFYILCEAIFECGICGKRKIQKFRSDVKTGSKYPIKNIERSV